MKYQIWASHSIFRRLTSLVIPFHSSQPFTPQLSQQPKLIPSFKSLTQPTKLTRPSTRLTRSQPITRSPFLHPSPLPHFLFPENADTEKKNPQKRKKKTEASPASLSHASCLPLLFSLIARGGEVAMDTCCNVAPYAALQC